QECAECVGRGRKTARHAHTGACQLADHLAQRGVFASYRVNIRHAELLERYYIRHKVTFEDRRKRVCSGCSTANSAMRAWRPPWANLPCLVFWRLLTLRLYPFPFGPSDFFP